MPTPYPDFMISEDTQLAMIPWRIKARLVDRRNGYTDSYNDIHAAFLAKGWTFADVLGDSLGSTEKLVANWHESHPANEDEHSSAAYWDAHFIPADIGFGTTLVDVFIMATEAPYDAAQMCDEDWINLVFGAGFFNPYLRFVAGYNIRIINRMAQLRAAMCLEQLLCMDTRGRPPAEAP